MAPSLQAISGGLCSSAAHTALVPVDVLKTKMQTDAFDWSIFQFVSSEAAYALATRLLAERKESEGGGAADDAGAAGGAEDEDEELS